MATQAELLKLVQKTASGDRAAFHALYELNAPLLYSVGIKILGQPAQVEEILQDVFINVWHQSRDYHSDRGEVKTWLISLMRYRTLDARRREQIGSRLHSDMQQNSAVVTASQSPDPADLLASGQSAMRLQDCMETLASDQRHAITGAFINGLTHFELAQQTGHPVGTLKSWIRRGLGSLRRCLNA